MSLTIESARGDEVQGQTHRVDGSGNGATKTTPPVKSRSAKRKRLALAGALLLGGLLLIVAVITLAGDLGGPDQPLIYYTARPGDLAITVTERGNLESQSNTEVICEVDDIHGDNINGTTILWIVPNGASVKKGDLLVQLDKASHQERLDEQILDCEEARAQKIKANAQYKNQKTQNETTEAEAELKVQLAELELKMFVDKEKGTHKLEVDAIKREIEDINNEILAAQANLALKKNDKLGIETLFKMGYAGKSELERSRLEFLQAESALASVMNKLTTEQATLDKKEDYERQMQLLTLQGAVETARRNQKQVALDNQALLDQTKAAAEAADESFKKEDELLERYREQVEKCDIYAPEDGMVAYATPRHRWHAEIQQGAPVAPKQHIISLPNLKQMQVKTAVHESVLDEVKIDLPATIRVDAFPDRSYRGSVQSVAVLPDQSGWMSSDTKVYETVVSIDEEVEQLKPGMTAVVEIHVDELRNVISIPVQAVVQIREKNWCYVDNGSGIERRTIELGRTNGKFIEIRKGVESGDRVVLNPMAIMDEGTKQEETAEKPDDSATEQEPREQEAQQPQRPQDDPPEPPTESDRRQPPAENRSEL